MNNFRSNLTRLRHQIEVRLPDGTDVYGYSGVSKDLLLSTVDKAYDLSYEIQQKDDQTRFEIIALKRFGSNVNSLLKEILESDDHKKRFDEFLDSLSTLIEKIKLTYFIVTKDGLRDDEELAVIRQTTATTKEECSELVTEKVNLEENIKKANLDVSAISVMREQADSDYISISTWRNESEKYYSEMSETHESIEGWDKEIEAYKNDILAKKAVFDDMSKRVVGLESRMNTNVSQSEASKDELAILEKEIKTLNEEARQTLGDVSRVGMAASFKKRKDELVLDKTVWQGVFVFAIIGLAIFAYRYVWPEITKPNVEWYAMLSRLAILSPFVWLGWFAARQFGYVSRIREDYAFKYAAAMAYEGHKQAAREGNPELEKDLLKFSIENMVLNPIRLYYMKPDHSTPIQEFIDNLCARFGRVAVSPSKVEVETESEGKK